MDNLVDVVVPYVDSTDLEWQKTFNKYNQTEKNDETNSEIRFRGQGEFFRYFFRGIEKNIVNLGDIYLIVASESQIPSWLDTSKIKIILHKDFIPEKYLPTFNSCTIEMFLWNIPNLREKFIYYNDDVYTINKIDSNYIFTNKLKFNVLNDCLDGIYGEHCRNNHKVIFGTLNSNNTCLRLDHGLRPFLKSEMKNCFNEHKSEILNSISTFRTTQNLSCYLFSLYLIKKGLQEQSMLSEIYTNSNVNKNTLKSLFDGYCTICINDTNTKVNVYENYLLNAVFYHNLNKKSIFELDDFKSDYKLKCQTDYIKNFEFGKSSELNSWSWLIS